ncbi:MAG: carbamoyltransferase [Candidatus Methylomirabilota bacterium]|nr:carbamoyltransferase [candidate division NC10 bacterium]PWB46366.1 MAG: carbamoyltransferase [candidate division NC10 bacterium]
MMILGINAYHGDASAVLLRDGELVAAVEEERFRRIKHWAGFPREAIRACLDMAGITVPAIDHIAISRDPRANLLQKTMFAVRKRPSLGLVADRVKNAGRIQDVAGTLGKELGVGTEEIKATIHWVEHHPAHLASSFFASPFEDAAVCAIDGFGDFVSTSLAVGRGIRLDVIEKVYFPHSLGLLYLALTQYLGFLKYGDEFKVMGLAPYGQPEYVDAVRRLLHLTPGGGFELDLPYFRHWSDSVSMTWEDGEPTMGVVYTPKIERLLGPARKPKEPITSRHEAIAASLQVVFEEAALHVLSALYEKTQLPRLCLAGGCAMNSVANGKIRERTPFKEVYIQPASGDNGTALGAALYVQHHLLGQRRRFVMEHGYWGPEFGEAEVSKVLGVRSEELRRRGYRTKRMEDEEELCRWTAERIAEGKIVGWFQGRMEWGARALGNRSILADPRRRNMRAIINTKIKCREKFRPFAPSVVEEAVDDYFVGAVPDSFMIQVYPVRTDKRDVIPAVTHVDGSGRLQTVNRSTNSLYWQLLTTFEKLTGVPVLLNTSFNENEPIVHKPEEAMDCFLRTDMDVLVMGRYAVEKVRSKE